MDLYYFPVHNVKKLEEPVPQSPNGVIGAIEWNIQRR